MKRYRLWNHTTQHWVRNEDGDVIEVTNKEDALRLLAVVDDLKKFQEKHKDDNIAISIINE